MNDQPKSKNTEKEDLELIIRSSQRQLRPLNTLAINPDIKKNIEKEQKNAAIDAQIKLFVQGYQALITEVMNAQVEGSYSRDPDIEPISIENFLITADKMDKIKQIITEENTTKTIKEICGFSKNVQLLFYEIAVYFHEQAHYEKAINAFTFLTMLNPKVQSFWIGLALAYEKNHNIDKAIQSFESAIKSDSSDFTPYYGLIRCYERDKDYKKIDDLLEAAKDNDAIKEQMAEVLEYLKSKK